MRLIIGACAVLMIASTAIGKGVTREANRIAEWTFTSAKTHADPFNEIELDAIFKTPSGAELRVPAFWAGGKIWRVRYASGEIGTHHFRTICSDANDHGLHGVEGQLIVSAYAGNNPLYQHGPIRIAANRRHFEHADGMPFFWLGDTWWMGLCHRLHWPDEFKTLAADRKTKGFNVVQIVAGLYPDMHPFDPRGANEAGFPWEPEYARIRPEYFDAADRRLQHLADEGLSPCIVGAWGYYMPWMGVEKMKKHWRYLIARYGALPVIWCAAGEANLPWYLAKNFPYDDRKQVSDWTEVMRYIRATDPFHRPLTIHPTGIGRLSARRATDDPALLDFDMLQTPHGQLNAVEPTLRTVRESYADKPIMPVIDGEAAYEMLFDNLPTEWTRRMFWVCTLNGAAGHTYGANGIWQCNRRGEPHGPSPHHSPGVGYGAISWDDAMNLPGSTQVALGAKLLQRFEWWKFEPHPEWAAWDDRKETIKWGGWIWHAADGDAAHDAPAAHRHFRKTFEVPADAKIERAIVHLTADDRFTVHVNGKQAGASDDSPESWRRPKRIDIAPLLRPGTNELTIDAENVAANVPSNPAGFICAGEVVLSNGKTIAMLSDATWQSSEDGKTFADAKVVAAYGKGPWGKFAANEAISPIVAGIPGDVRVIYLAAPKAVRVLKLDRDVQWRAEAFDPLSGKTTPLPEPIIAADGSARFPAPAGATDWVLVLRR